MYSACVHIPALSLVLFQIRCFGQQDCEDSNPLIRALAVRTMGCIRVDKITEYLCEPLRKCLKDEDPYVRKTAAVCVAKMHDINAPLVEDQGFLDLLKDLLSDSNPMVSNRIVHIIMLMQAIYKVPTLWLKVLNNVNIQNNVHQGEYCLYFNTVRRCCTSMNKYACKTQTHTHTHTHTHMYMMLVVLSCIHFLVTVAWLRVSVGVHFTLLQVVANAVAAISEILETSPTAQQSLEMNMGTINKLLTALNECSEYVSLLIHFLC